MANALSFSEAFKCGRIVEGRSICLHLVSEVPCNTHLCYDEACKYDKMHVEKTSVYFPKWVFAAKYIWHCKRVNNSNPTTIPVLKINCGCANSEISARIEYEPNSVKYWPKRLMLNQISYTKILFEMHRKKGNW